MLGTLRQAFFALACLLVAIDGVHAMFVVRDSRIRHQGQSLETGVEFAVSVTLASPAPALGIAVVPAASGADAVPPLCTESALTSATQAIRRRNGTMPTLMEGTFTAPAGGVASVRLCIYNQSAPTRPLMAIAGGLSLPLSISRSTYQYRLPSPAPPAGAYTGIQLLGPADYSFTAMAATGRGDVVKLVPSGAPCSRNATSHCGAVLSEACIVEQSFVGGVLPIGSRTHHPLLDGLAASATSGNALAFGVLPTAAGGLDVCFSSAAHRASFADAPSWRKLPNAGATGACQLPALANTTCTETFAFIPESAVAPAIAWSSMDVTELTWGAIELAATGGTISTFAATTADCPTCSSTRDFFGASADGVAVRVVPISAFGAASTMAVTPAATTATVSERVVPSRGTVAAELGCWSTAFEAVWPESASYDIGAPSRSSVDAASLNATDAAAGAAFVRFPPAGNYSVCLRDASGAWRRLPRTLRVAAAATSAYRDANLRASLNDTRSGTLGEITLHASKAILTLQATNIFDAAVADTAVRGLLVRLVSAGASCFASALAETMNLGSRECHPADCGYSSTCGLGQCNGRQDDSPTLVARAVAFLIVPAEAFTVCVRVNSRNWFAAGNFTPSAQPDLVYSIVEPVAAGTLAAVSVTHATAYPEHPLFDVRRSTASGGDMMRVIPADAPGCDHTWLPSARGAFVPNATVVDLGVNCTPSASSTRCDDSLTDGPVNGQAPFTRINTSFDGLFHDDASVGFVAIARTLASGPLRVCYKQRGLNWYELPNAAASTVTIAPTTLCTAAGASSFASGTRGYLTVSCGASTPLSNASTLVKLTPVAAGCSAEAAGGTAAFQRFSTLSSTSVSDGGAWLADAASPAGAVAYSFAAPAGVTAATAFSVCVMPPAASGSHWINAGSITVAPSGLSATVPASLFHRQSVLVRVASVTATLDVRPSRDAGKVVGSTDPCTGLTDPVVAMGGARSRDVTSGTYNGSTDLGPDDSATTTEAIFTATMPPATGTACYKVCLWSHASASWYEVPVPQSFCAVAAPAEHLVVSPRLLSRASSVGGRTNVTALSAGASTGWSFALTNGFTQDAVVVGSADELLIRLPSSATSATSTHLKFVATEYYEAPNWRRVPGTPSCTDAAYHPLATAAQTGAGGFSTDVPALPGTYLVCWSPDGTGWIAVKLQHAESGAQIPNPVVVAPIGAFATVDADVVSVFDDSQDAVSGASTATLAAADAVYFTNVTSGSCGDAAAWFAGSESSDVAGRVQFLTVANGSYATSTSGGASARATPANASAVPSAQEHAGMYRLCLFKTIDGPVAQRNMWYALPFAVPLVDGSAPPQLVPWLRVGDAQTLTLTCSSELATVSLSAESLTGTSMVVEDATLQGAGFTLVATTDACSSASAPWYGVTASSAVALPRFATAADVSSTAPCAAEAGCNVSAQAMGLTASCAVDLPMQPAASLRLTVPAVCLLLPAGGTICPVTVTAFDSVGAVATLANDTVRVSATAGAGLTIAASTFTGALTQGTFSAQVLPTGQPTANVTVTVTAVSLNTSITATAAMVIPAPMVDGLTLRAVTPAAPRLGLPDWHATQPLPQASASSVRGTAEASGFIVAGEYYHVDVDATAAGKLVPSTSALINTTSVTVALLTASGSPMGAETNALIGPLPAGADAYTYAVPHPAAVALASVSRRGDGHFRVRFQLRSGAGCRFADGGCIIRLGAGAASAEVHTVVRSEAVSIEATCRPAGSSANYTGDCGSAVEHGFDVRLRALDQFGNVDELYRGAVALQFDRTATAASAIDRKAMLTTVPALQTPAGTDNTTTVVVDGDGSLRVTLRGGIAVVARVSTGAPCTVGCVVAALPLDWSGQPSSLTLRTQASTSHLRCSMDTAHLFAVSNGQRAAVIDGNLSTAIIYADTELCFDVWAANAAGDATLYETTWAYFHLIGGGPGVVAREVGLHPRMAPMQRSRVRFCLVLSGGTSAVATTANVGFGVQSFGTDAGGAASWTQGSTGRCAVGPLTLLPAKTPHALVATAVASATFASLPTTHRELPTSRPWLIAEHELPLSAVTSRVHTVTVTFGLHDVYGHDAAMLTSHRVVVEGCDPANAAATACDTGTGNASVSNAVRVAAAMDARDGGMLSVRVAAATSASVTFEVSRACLHCSVAVALYDGAGPALSATGEPLVATVSLSLVLPVVGSNRHAAFVGGTSPVTAGVWRFVTPTSPQPAKNNATLQTLIHTDCVGPGAACAVPDADLSAASCGGTASPPLLGLTAAGAPVRVGVFMSTLSASSSALAQGSGACAGSSDPAQCTAAQAPVGVGHVDVFTAYTVAITGGADQALRCTTPTSCSGDGTHTVSVPVAAAGRSVAEAILALENATTVGAAVAVSALLPSASYAVVSGKPSSPPSRRGEVRLTATDAAGAMTVSVLTSSSAALTGAAGPLQAVWRGAPHAARLTVLDETSEAGCLSTPQRATWVAGRNVSMPLTAAYAGGARWEQGVPIPFTVLAVGADGGIATDVRGTMTPSLHRADGCGNGGDITHSGGSFVDGRATVHVTFATPCEACVLRFALSRNQDDVAAAGLATIPGGLIAVSKPVDVVAQHHSAVGAVVAPSVVPAQVNVMQTLRFDVGLRAAVADRVQDAAHSLPAAATARVWAVIMPANATSAADVGSSTGGVLSGRTEATLTASSPTATLEVAFTRQCAACRIHVLWTASLSAAAGPSSGAVELGNTAGGVSIHVSRAATGSAVAGVPQRLVHTGRQMVLVLRPSEAGDWADGAVALDAAGVQFATINGSNGNGGSPSIAVARQAAHGGVQVVLTTTTPCALCHVQLLGHALPVSLVTSATHVRLNSLAPLVTTVTGGFGVELSMSDDAGFVDTTIGGPTDCRVHPRFACTYVTPLVQMVLSADGATVGGFVPTSTSLTVGGRDPALSIALSSNMIADGRTRNMRATLTTPLRGLRPIFTVEQAALATTNRTRTVPTVDVNDPSTVPVIVATAATQFSHHTLTPMSIHVGVARAFGGRNYVAGLVNTTLTVAFNAACGPQAAAARTVSVVRGLANFSVLFDSATPAASPCIITFRAPSFVACTTCAASVSVIVTDPAITGFEWLRPTPIENGDSASAAGPRYGVAGRTMRLSFRGLATFSAATLPIRRCATGCDATVTPINCTFPPSTVAKRNHMAVNGTVEFDVTWPSSPAAAASHTCPISTVFTRNGATVAEVMSTVSVCTPHHVAAGNISGGATLFTGAEYSWDATIVDASGQRCRGDSQEDATLLTLTVTAADGSPTDVRALNVETRSATTVELGTAPVVRALGGHQRFRVILTGPSTNPLHLRVEAQSRLPALAAHAVSPAFVTVVRAARLRMRSDAAPPAYLVRNRLVRSAAGLTTVLQAVDAVRDEWAFLAPGAPQVDRAAAGIVAEWVVDPAASPFPIAFAAGQTRLTSLTLGEAVVPWNFTGADGTYSITLRDATPVTAGVPALAGSAPMSVVVQSAVSGGVWAASGAWCQSGCALPNFAPATSATGAMPSVREGAALEIRVAVLDPNGAPVLGDNSVVVGLRLLRFPNATSAARLRHASVATAYGPLLQPVRQGTATVSFTIEGTTARVDGTGNHDPVTLELFCPRLPGVANECEAFTLQASTVRFAVTSSAATVDTDAELALYRPSIKVPLNIASLAGFDAALFRTRILDVLLAAGPATWPQHARDANSRILLTPCEVDRVVFGFGDLEGRVCGANGACSVAYDSSCPSGVRLCSCGTAAATPQQQKRRLLQLPTPTAASLSLQVEVGFQLAASDVVTFSDIPAMYTAVVQAVVNALRGDASLRDTFQVETANIQVVQRGLRTSAAPSAQPTSATPGSTAAVDTSSPGIVSSAFGRDGGHALVALLAITALAALF